jgi:hypothetical protein
METKVVINKLSIIVTIKIYDFLIIYSKLKILIKGAEIQTGNDNMKSTELSHSRYGVLETQNSVTPSNNFGKIIA